MSKVRNIHIMVIFFSMLFASCNGMHIAKTAYKKSYPVLKYGIPVSIVAAIIYNVYSYFFFINRMAKNAKNASDGIIRVDGKVDIVDQKIDVVDAKLSMVQCSAELIKNDTQELKSGQTELKSQMGMVREEMEERIQQLSIKIDQLKSEILQKMVEGEMSLSDLIKLVEANVRKDLKNSTALLSGHQTSLADKLEQVGGEHKKMFDWLQQQLTDGNDTVKEGLAKNDENYRDLQTRMSKLEDGVTKLLQLFQIFAQAQNSVQAKEEVS